MKTVENGSITSPLGFKAAGISGGLKKSGKPDLALIVADTPCPYAAAFTANQIPGISGRRYPAELAGEAYPEFHKGLPKYVRLKSQLAPKKLKEKFEI